MLQRLKHARDTLVRLGWLGFAEAIGGRIAARVGWHYRRIRLLELDLTRLPAPPGADTTPRRLTCEDFQRFGDRQRHTPAYLARIEQRLADPNARAYGIIENGRMVAVAWLSCGPVALDGAPRDFGANATSGYLWGDFTLPHARRRGFHRMLIAHRLQVLKSLGYARARAVVDAGNRASLNSFSHFGFRIADTRTTLRRRKHRPTRHDVP